MSNSENTGAGNEMPLQAIWGSLLVGDPGPALAFVDALIEHDMAFAAGGFLRDLAERLKDAPVTIEGELQLHQFTEATQQTLLHACNGDASAVSQLLDESE